MNFRSLQAWFDSLTDAQKDWLTEEYVDADSMNLKEEEAELDDVLKKETSWLSILNITQQVAKAEKDNQTAKQEWLKTNPISEGMKILQLRMLIEKRLEERKADYAKKKQKIDDSISKSDTISETEITDLVNMQRKFVSIAKTIKERPAVESVEHGQAQQTSNPETQDLIEKIRDLNDKPVSGAEAGAAWAAYNLKLESEPKSSKQETNELQTGDDRSVKQGNNHFFAPVSNQASEPQPESVGKLVQYIQDRWKEAIDDLNIPYRRLDPEIFKSLTIAQFEQSIPKEFAKHYKTKFLGIDVGYNAKDKLMAAFKLRKLILGTENEKAEIKFSPKELKALQNSRLGELMKLCPPDVKDRIFETKVVKATKG